MHHYTTLISTLLLVTSVVSITAESDSYHHPREHGTNTNKLNRASRSYNNNNLYDNNYNTESGITGREGKDMEERCGCCTGAAGTPGVPGVPGMHGQQGIMGNKGDHGEIGTPGILGEYMRNRHVVVGHPDMCCLIPLLNTRIQIEITAEIPSTI